MTDYQIQATFKFGAGYDEAWTTIASNDPDEFLQLNSEFTDRLAEAIASTAATVRAVNAVARGVGEDNVVPFKADKPAPAATTAAPAAELPDGVKVWVAPNPEKPQYEELWYEYPFIGGDAGKRFRDDLKAALGGFARFHSGSKNWYTKKDNEAALRTFFIENADAFSK